VGNEILYCGYRFDPETGLDHVRHRYYHPTLGRWVQRDPWGYSDGSNLSQYVNGQPLHVVDPAGLWNRDVHQELTTTLAKSAGYACPEQVGLWANAPDTDLRDAQTSFILAAALRGLGTANDPIPDSLIRRAAEWHFPADPNGEVTPGSDAARAKVKAGIEKCDLEAFAEGLHPLQDSWSHQGKPLWEGLGHARGKAHETKYVQIQTWREPGWSGPPTYAIVTTTRMLGPLEAVLSHSADITTDWPASARATGKETYQQLLNFKRKCPCACPPKTPGGPNTPTSSGEAADTEAVKAYLERLFPGND
jgi:RHS repeat-associated protein